MLSLEPVIHCLSADTDKLFYPHGEEAEDIKDAYAMVSAISTLIYWLLLADLTVFCAFCSFLLVSGRVVSDEGMFLGALIYLIVTFQRSLQPQPKTEGLCRLHMGAL